VEEEQIVEMAGDSLLRTRHLRLSPVLPKDYPLLYHIAVVGPDAFRWRFRGSQPSFEDFVGSVMRSSVFCHFVMELPESRLPVGYVVCYEADFRNRHAHIACVGTPEFQGHSFVLEGMEGFINYLFKCWDFEKLCAECPEFNIHAFESGVGRVFAEEGRLVNHERFRGRAWDLHLLAIHRGPWNDYCRSKEEMAGRVGESLRLDEFGRAVTIEDFLAAIKDEQGIDLSADTRLPLGQAGLDSLAIFEVISMIEAITGASVPDHTLLEVRTVEDLYHVYLELTLNGARA
jgi:RimJ/RimL family protein N-acetyltransferase/acyl carrier protein